MMIRDGAVRTNSTVLECSRAFSKDIHFVNTGWS